MEGKSFQYLALFAGLFLCLLHCKGVLSICDDIEMIDFAEITYPSSAPHPEGSVANISCSFFYQIVPNNFKNTTCINGSWSGRLPRCRHRPEYCNRHEGLIRIQEKECQTPRCNRQRRACPVNKRCICDGVCGWTCLPIYEDNFCPEVAEEEGVLVTYDPPERRFQGKAYFSCREGYTPNESGSERLRCMSNRNWGGGNQFICIPNSICGDPPTVDNASLQPSNKHFFLPGDTRSYVCNSGFSIRGSREITCDADYEWSEQAFSCTPRSCGYPGRLPNADLTTRVYQYRSRAVYVCREGYENPPYTLNYRTCLENGEWSRILPTCEPVRCPEILGIANGRVDSWGHTFESQVRFECNEGYRLDGSQRRVCQGDKTWSGTETVCTEVICEDQGTLINGYKTNEKSVYRLNDVIYYHCNDGFTRDGEPLSYCTESGNWQYPMPVCGESCTVPPHPRDGQWTNLQPESIVTHNTRLELRCRNWRFTERLNNVRCNDGEWSDSDAVRLCKGRPCGMRGSNDIALNIAYDPPISDEDRSSHLIPHDTRVHYECERGYRLNGNQEMRCSQGSYGYGSNVPTCEPVPCQEEGVPHGKFVYTSPSQPLKRSNPHHGDTRRLDCRNGYRPWGFTQSRCDNGQWDNNGSQDFRCEPKPCEPLENVMNKKSISYSTSQENGKYSHGTVLTVHCNTDYIPAYGNGTVTCNASRWWPVIPTCLHSRNKIKESDSSQTPSWRGNFIDSAWLARDGHKDSGEEYCSRTRVTKNPWWKTVMDVVYNLTLVKIYNRLDRNYHRYDLVGAEVRIGVHEDYSRNQLCGAPITHQQVADSNEENHGIAIRCVRNGSAGIYGSVVSVHIPTGPDEERELSLCEVEVYEEGSSISVNGPRNGSRVGCIVPDVENADITNIGIAKQQFVLAGTSIRISCNAGHTLRGSDDSRHVGLHCLDSSSWDESEPVCEPLRMERLCSKPGYIFQVRQYVNGEETKELVTYPNDEIPEGTFLVSRCSQPGQYVLRGSANRTCLDGQWTGQEPSCVLADTSIIFQNNQPLEVRNDGTIIIFPRSQLYIYCRLPFDSNKAAYLESDRGQSGAYWNPYPLTTMIMNLNPPRPSQSGRFTCRSADSSLSHSVNIQFTEIYCAQPQTPANGGYRNYDFHQPIEGHYMGKSITYTCDNGYVLHGQRRITCILGEWSHPAPTCQRATCEELHAPDNGMIVGGNRIGDSVLIGCNRGYRLHGENFLDCLETGEWSHPMSVCVETPQPVHPCDLVNCEVWQMCETDINGVGECLCISPRECPETEEPSVVCGTDGQNYTNLCQLKAYACQRGSGVEVASNSTSCIIGVPERVPLTSAPDVYESPSMSSSFDIHVDSGPSFPEETQPAVEEPEANAAHLFCHASDCPAIPGTEYCRNATAIVIAYPYNWDDQNGIMTIEIYEVIRGDLPSWTKESHQEVHLDVEDLSIGDCVCPSFESQDPVIIRFTQNLTQDGIPWLLNTDIVLLYSQQLSDDIEECLQELEPEPTPEVPQGDQNSSFLSYNERGPPTADGDPPSVDGGQTSSGSAVITTTASVSRESVASPTASFSESSWDIV